MRRTPILVSGHIIPEPMRTQWFSHFEDFSVMGSHESHQWRGLKEQWK